MLTAPAKPRPPEVLQSAHQRRKLDIVYYEKGRYIPQALAEIDYIPAATTARTLLSR